MVPVQDFHSILAQNYPYVGLYIKQQKINILRFKLFLLNSTYLISIILYIYNFIDKNLF